MASTTTVSQSDQIPSGEITTGDSASHDNSLKTIFQSDVHNNFSCSNSPLDENAKTVSEEEGSSPSAMGDDNENSSLGMIENPEQNYNDDGPADEDELLFLQDEEDKIMQQDEDLIMSSSEVGVTSATDSQLPDIEIENNTKTFSSITKEISTLPANDTIHQHISNSCSNESKSPDSGLQISERDLSGDNLSIHIDLDSSIKITKRVKILDVANPIRSNETSENNEFSLKRNRIDSIDLDAHTFDFDGMGIGLSNTSGISVDETKSSNLPPLGNENKNDDLKGEQVQKNIELMPSQRGRGYSLDFFAFGMNEDEPIPPTSTASADIQMGGINSIDNCANINEYHQSHVDQSIGNSAINDFDAKLRPRGDSIIFDPSSFGEGGIHEANALERSRRPSISLDVDEMEIMNAPGFVEPQTHVPDCCESQMPGTVTNDANTIQEANNYQHPALVQPQINSHAFRNPHMQARAPSYAPTPLNNSLTQNNRTIPSLISMPSETILTPDAMSGSSGVLQIDQMELLNKGGRIGLYLPNARKERIAKFHSKRKMRIWRKRIKYDCRKKLADSRPRIKGRFVKRSDVD